MTGEITLTGRILPIGGVKEKVLAAHRNSIFSVVLPEGNRKDLDDIPSEVRDAMSFTFVSNAAEALGALFPEGAIGPSRASLARRASLSRRASASKPRAAAKKATGMPRAIKAIPKKR